MNWINLNNEFTMVRFVFVSLLFIHGLIHAIGFMNQWVLATSPQLSGRSTRSFSTRTARLLGFLWLLTGLGFLLTAVTYWFQMNGWTSLALASILLSQTLIILFWSDAKVGTLANVLIALSVWISIAHNRFEEYADQEARQVMIQPTTVHQVIDRTMLIHLPMPVQQWLIASGVVGKEQVHTVRLQQKGLMRTNPRGRWMPTQAEQYIDVDKPGFVWKADVRPFAWLPLAGLDKYADGKGTMQIKALSFIPIVNASDAKIDQGELLRYLSEMCWYPSAALRPYITWQPIDEKQSEATINYKGVTASAVFTFDAQHRLVSVAAKRYKGDSAQSQLEDWYIPARSWKIINGVRIPVKGDVIWKLPTGDFNYYQWEIAAIDYNKRVLY